MNTALKKRSIVTKTMQVGSMTLLSRALGIIRVALLPRFLGVGVLSDAFTVAFMLPNSLRKIFAEGALSAAFVPVFIKLMRSGDKKTAYGVMSLGFLFFEGILALLCLLIFFAPVATLQVVAPGFSAEQLGAAVPMLRILIGFILFVSSSSLLAGALQSVNHFFVPSFGPVLLNIVFIAALLLGLWFGLSVHFLCLAIMVGGLLMFLMHMAVYVRYNFAFGAITPEVKQKFTQVLKTFGPVCFSMSIVEISLIIDTAFSSYLPAGTPSLIQYSNRFMGIPLGVFAVSFSTIMLSHFSRVSTYAPKRLGYFVYESIKLIFWITIPATLFMVLFAQQILATVFLSDRFPMEYVIEAKWILIAYLVGLFFFSLNKVLLNAYYALHEARTPLVSSIISTVANIGLNALLMWFLKAPGLALATSISGIIQTGILLYYLHAKHKLPLYYSYLARFMQAACLQLLCMLTLFYIAYIGCYMLFNHLPRLSFLLGGIGFWLWVGPLMGAGCLFLYFTRKWFGIKLYFID